MAKNKLKILEGNQIEWANHGVAFISSMLGILIAFQLEMWRESRSENEKTTTALTAIQKEIENNIRIYQANADTILLWLDYVDFGKVRYKEGVGIVVSEKEFARHASKDPERFSDFKFVRKYNDSMNVYTQNYVRLMKPPATGISVDSWEAAKSSGVLNNLDHARLTSLTRIYNWTKMNLGGEEEFYRNYVSSGFDIEVGIDKIIKDFRSTANVSKFKKEKIEEEFKKLPWEVK